MSDLLFSILVPCVPSRVDKLTKLFEYLDKQIGELPVEVLALLDNKKRTVGLKRDALVQSARGKYLAFCDDDDWVAPDYVARIVEIASKTDADVIVFDQKCQLNDDPPFIVHHGIEFDMMPARRHDGITGPLGKWDDITRKPWHHNAWKTTLAQSVRFPDSSFGEDGTWCSQLWPLVKVQERIDAVLHYYQWSAKTTEAS
jgi:glycosyltransferase involved in cell wall biosynthesis